MGFDSYLTAVRIAVLLDSFLSSLLREKLIGKIRLPLLRNINFFFLFCSSKDAFHERVKVYQHWQHSQMMLTKKREQKVRLECAGRTDKLEQATNEVIEVSLFRSAIDFCYCTGVSGAHLSI